MEHISFEINQEKSGVFCPYSLPRGEEVCGLKFSQGRCEKQKKPVSKTGAFVLNSREYCRPGRREKFDEYSLRPGERNFMKHLIKIALILLVVWNVSAQSQKYFLELNGFRLKQYRETAQSEFGKPDRSGKLDNGFEYEAFLLNPDESLYMVFEYSPDRNDIIWGIQITGTDATADFGFQGLKFGMSSAQAEKILGKATGKVDVGEYGQRWEYKNSNFSIEINPEGKLSSIKIKDAPPESESLPDAKKIPQFAGVLKTLTSKDNAEMAKMLAPDMELYLDKQTLFFGRSLRKEIAADSSKIFAIIRDLAADLKTVNVKNADEYEENLRMTLGQDPKHVIKLKKGHKIREIVFKYEWGQFLIWEVKASAKP
jgi:hypothetical protein